MHPNDGRVISNFIVQSLKNQSISVFGDGSQTRSFCYVDDLIEGLVRMMNSDDAFTGPVNLGAPAEFSILDLARKIIDMTSSKSRITFCALPEDDPQQRQPDITLARRELGWEPTVKLEEGLTHTIAYFDRLLREESI
jgi:UDP-glucuronate decarboxylase